MKNTRRKLMVVAVMALSFATYTLAGTAGGSGGAVCCTDNSDCPSGTCTNVGISCHSIPGHTGGGDNFCGTPAGGGGGDELQ